jgi:hypothetical protein
MDVSDGCLRLAIPTGKGPATHPFETTFLLLPAREAEPRLVVHKGARSWRFGLFSPANRLFLMRHVVRHRCANGAFPAQPSRVPFGKATPRPP